MQAHIYLGPHGRSDNVLLDEGSVTVLDFGTTATPVSQMLTLTNTGTADLTFGTVTVTGTSAGAFATSTLPVTLAAGSAADLTVTYTPAGNDMASLAITDRMTAAAQPPAAAVTRAAEASVAARS